MIPQLTRADVIDLEAVEIGSRRITGRIYTAEPDTLLLYDTTGPGPRPALLGALDHIDQAEESALLAAESRHRAWTPEQQRQLVNTLIPATLQARAPATKPPSPTFPRRYPSCPTRSQLRSPSSSSPPPGAASSSTPATPSTSKAAPPAAAAASNGNPNGWRGAASRAHADSAPAPPVAATPSSTSMTSHKGIQGRPQ